MDAKKLGEFIAAVRKEHKMTQADLAAKVHVTDKAVSKWERGISFPDITNIEPIAEALDVSPLELIKAEHIAENNNYADQLNSAFLDGIEYARTQRKKDLKKALRIGATVLLVALVLYTFLFILIMGTFQIGYGASDPVVSINISEYNDFFGKSAKKEYKYKMMNDSIFPERITDQMRVADFKMVYYNPFDAQYLSYLVVDYSADAFAIECERLSKREHEAYKNIYCVTGFNEDYELLAMNSDDYNGFVYALKGDGNRIIYVELIFCNYFLDLEYEKYIPNSYLPLGFNAHLNNPYQLAHGEEK